MVNYDKKVFEISNTVNDIELSRKANNFGGYETFVMFTLNFHRHRIAFQLTMK